VKIKQDYYCLDKVLCVMRNVKINAEIKCETFHFSNLIWEVFVIHIHGRSLVLCHWGAEVWT